MKARGSSYISKEIFFCKSPAERAVHAGNYCELFMLADSRCAAGLNANEVINSSRINTCERREEEGNGRKRREFESRASVEL